MEHEDVNIDYNDDHLYGDDADGNIFYEDQDSNDQEMHYVNQVENPDEGHYGDNHNDQEEYTGTSHEYTDHSQDLFRNSSIDSLKNLSLNGLAIDEEIKALEEELQTLTAMTLAANTFKREELNILNPNFSLLTRKVEEKKRRENVFKTKVITKRVILSNDLRQIVQPGVQKLKNKILKNSKAHDENGLKAKEIFEEKKKSLKKEYLTTHENYDDINTEVMKTMKNIDEWLREIDNIDNALVNANENVKKYDFEISLKETEIQQLEQDIDSSVIEKLKKSIEDYQRMIDEQEETAKKVMDEAEKKYEAVKEDIDELDKKQDFNKIQVQEVIKKMETVIEDKGFVSTTIQNLNVKIQESHLEKLTLDNFIQADLRNLEHLSHKIGSTIESLQKVENDYIKLNENIAISKEKHDELTKTITETDCEILKLQNKLQDLPCEISRKNDMLIAEKTSQCDLKMISKRSEYYDRLTIIEKENQDIENNYAEENSRFKETKDDVKKKENQLTELIDQQRIHIENFSLDLENKASDVTYREHEIENEVKRQQNDIILLKQANEEIIDRLKLNRDDHFKLVSGIQQETNTEEEKVKKTDQIISNIQQLEIPSLKANIEQMLQYENEEEKNLKNNEETIFELEMELNKLNDSIMEDTEELISVQKERANDQSTLNLEKDLKNVNEILQNSKKELAEIKKLVQTMQARKESACLIDLLSKKEEEIKLEEINYEKNKEKTMILFKDQIEKAELNLANMKKSQANKMNMYKTGEMEKNEMKRTDIKRKIEKSQKEIEIFKEKSAEIEGKIRKKKTYFVSCKERWNKVSQILRENGMEDMAGTLEENLNEP